jgi:hypothetical protein
MTAEINALKAAARAGKEEAEAKEAAKAKAQKEQVDREKELAVFEKFAESDRAATVRQRKRKLWGPWAPDEVSVCLRPVPL